MKKIYQILGLCLLIIASMQTIQAQKGPIGGGSVTIVGPTNSSTGTSENYTITTSSGLLITSANWTVIGGGGTVQIQNNTSATIQWTTAGTHTIKYQVTASNQGALIDNHSVTVTTSLGPVAPPTPYVANITCTSAELIATGTVPSGHVWYWQGVNPFGTSTINSASSNYMVSSNGTYYIKAYEASSNQWSIATPVIVALSTPTWYADLDGDGLGDLGATLTQCTQPNNYVSNSNDQCPNEDGDGSSTGCLVPISLSNQNYVYAITPQKEISSLGELILNKDAIKNVTYLDGMGRPIQSLGIKQSATEKDIITHFKYDSYSRLTRQYLPYVSTNNSGSYVDIDSQGNDAGDQTKAYYQSAYSDDFINVPLAEVNPYSENELEASPLNRVLKIASPGKDWKLGNGHESKIEYHVNSINEVRLFGVNSSGTLTLNGHYHAGELYKTITKDENWTVSDGKNHTIEKFENQEGQVILKRHYSNYDLNADGDTNDAGESSEVAHDTFYVYDTYGNLVFVLPPESEANSASIITIISTLNTLAYQYKYDSKNRISQKKLPGKGWGSVVYDKLDRPVIAQDALQKLSNQWIFTKYDKLGRVAYTGLFTDSRSQSSIQSHLNNTNNLATELYESRQSAAGSLDTYYTNGNFPTNIEVLTVSHYDDYNTDYDDLNITSINPSSIVHEYGNIITDRVKGLPTISRIKVLDITPNKWITTITYYDKKGRPIHIYTENDYLDTTDIIQTKLDFLGKIEESKNLHTNTNNLQATISTIDSFTYDHVGRLLEQRQSINGATEEVIFSNVYDELGQLIEKGVGGSISQNRLQTVDYTYNVRGWLKNINQDTNGNDNDLFNFTLRYNDATDTSKNLFNGNISQTSWNTANTDASTKTYTYTYDAMNRLLKGILTSTNTSQNNRYDLNKISYDKNGNILSLQRQGHINTSATNFDVMDNLIYTYNSNSNQLRKVVDNGNDTYGFKNIVDLPTAEYDYDVNGNMTFDANKGITNINYNHLNLPTQVTINGNTITYVYDAMGIKLRKIAGTTTTDYANGYIYKNNTLQYMSTDEGYVQYEGSNIFSYVYSYVDHLGNVRLSYRDTNPNNTSSTDLEIVKESNYYPLGLKHKGYNTLVSPNGNSTANKLGFTGKEDQEEFDLDWLDVTARNYDPALGRWMNIDPLAEQMRRHSPYNYAFNNPVFFIDPDGMAPQGAGNAYGVSREFSAGGGIGQFGQTNYTITVTDSNGDVVGRIQATENEVGGLVNSYGGNITFQQKTQKLHHNTTSKAADAIQKNGFSASKNGRFSKYNWVSAKPSAGGTGVQGLDVTLSIEGVNVSDAVKITSKQMDNFYKAAKAELGYTSDQIRSSTKISKQVNSLKFKKLGQYLDKMGASSYKYGGSYALTDDIINTGTKITRFNKVFKSPFAALELPMLLLEYHQIDMAITFDPYYKGLGDAEQFNYQQFGVKTPGKKSQKKGAWANFWSLFGKGSSQMGITPNLGKSN